MAVVARKVANRSPGFLGLIFSLSLFGSIGQLAATAKEIPAANKAGLVAAIDTFEAAMKNRDFTKIINGSVPPTLLQFIAAKAGIKGSELDKFKDLIKMRMVNALTRGKIVSFGMDKKTITCHELADGKFYALIPTQTVMDLNGKHWKVTGQTLGFEEKGHWYLMRVANAQQVGMVRAVYPQFKKVEFKVGSVEEVK